MQFPQELIQKPGVQQQGGLGYTGCTLEADHPANIDNLGIAKPTPSREEKSYLFIQL